MLILNKIQLTGRVGRISTRDLQDKKFVTMRISIPEKYTRQDQQPEDLWLSVTVFGKAAEFAEKFVGVGDYVYVEGRVKEHKYQDKQGIDRSEVQVLTSELQIVQKKQDKTDAASAPQPPVNPHLAELQGEDSDLPF